MLAVLSQIEFWWWWSLGLGLLVLEMLVPGTFFLWLGVAAGIVGALVLLIPDVTWQTQFLVFAVLSVTAIGVFRIWLRKHPTESDDELLNRRGDQYIGHVVVVLDSFQGGRGRVKLGDTSWLAKSVDGSDFAAGAKARVTEVDGATLTVEVAS